MDRVGTILAEVNPWWRDPDARIPGVRTFRRQPAFDRVRGCLFRGDRRRGAVLIGLRWVGKTEVARQIADEVRQDLPGTQVAYVSTDEPRLRGALSIDQVLGVWDPVRRKDTPALLVIDEVHRLADPSPDGSWGWARQLKGVLDEGHVEVLATGSDAGQLREGAAEAPGRWEYVELEPLSFEEFRHLRVPVPGETQPLDATRVEDLISYLRVGGFPDLAQQGQQRGTLQDLQHYARDILLDELGDIRQHTKVEHAFAILMDGSGSNLDVTSLGKAIGAKAETVERWLDAMESVRLIQRVPRIRRIDSSTLHRIKGQPKIHGADPGLVSAFSRWSDALSNEHSRGSLYESAVLRHLREVAREAGPGAGIYCLQISGGRGKPGEIDFVLVGGDGEVFLIEVTSGGAGIQDKAWFLRRVAEDSSILGGRRVHAVVVAPMEVPTRAGVPVVDLGRFLETLVPVVPVDRAGPLDPLRQLCVEIGGD